MGLDPASWAAIGAIGGLGLSAYQSSRKPSAPATPGAPPTPIDAEPLDKKTKKYRRPAQVFKDEDLRLGVSGSLGL